MFCGLKDEVTGRSDYKASNITVIRESEILCKEVVLAQFEVLF
jgi:hypothetical protein